MNAPASTATVAAPKPTLEILPIGAIKPSPTHIQELRRERFDKKALQDLADSIKQVGVLQPIVVRPDGLAGKYELVAGERRWLAAKLAGLTEIRASVCVLTPEQVLEIQLIENLQREGLHELEEAEGYEELMKLKKIGADVVADMVGKSRSYVYARTKLLALCPEARKSFYAHEIDASRALLVARIGHHDTQRQALLDLTKGEAGYGGRREGEAMSYREAHRHVLQNYMLQLSKAPFDIKDAQLLPKAGDCIKCPKRTGNAADLFGDVKNADVCTDPKCFDDKRQAHHAIARKKKEAEGRKVIYGAEAKKLLLNWEHNSNDYVRGEYIAVDASEYVGGRYQKVKGVLGKDYVPTLLQHPLSGKFIEVAPRSTVASKASLKSKTRSSPSSASQSKAAVERYNKLDKARQLEQRIREETNVEVFKQLHKKVATVSTQDLLSLGTFFCQGDINSEVMVQVLECKKGTNYFTTLKKHLQKLKGAQLLKAIYLLYVNEEHNRSFQPESKQYDDIEEHLTRYKIDPAAIEKEVRAKLAPKPVDKVNAAIDKRGTKAKVRRKPAKKVTAKKKPAAKKSKKK